MIYALEVTACGVARQANKTMRRQEKQLWEIAVVIYVGADFSPNQGNGNEDR